MILSLGNADQYLLSILRLVYVACHFIMLPAALIRERARIQNPGHRSIYGQLGMPHEQGHEAGV